MMIPLTCYGLEGSAKMKSHEKFMNNISTPGCPHGLSSSSANFCSRSDFNFGRYLTSDSFERSPTMHCISTCQNQLHHSEEEKKSKSQHREDFQKQMAKLRQSSQFSASADTLTSAGPLEGGGEDAGVQPQAFDWRVQPD